MDNPTSEPRQFTEVEIDPRYGASVSTVESLLAKIDALESQLAATRQERDEALEIAERAEGEVRQLTERITRLLKERELLAEHETGGPEPDA